MLNQVSIDLDKVSQEDVDNYTSQALLALKNEIQNDSEKMGYAGKSNQEVADLLNNPYEVSTQQTVNITLTQAIQNELENVNMSSVSYIIDSQGNITCDPVFETVLQGIVDTAKTKVSQQVESKTQMRARVMDILVGIPYVNNQVTADDIAVALK